MKILTNEDVKNLDMAKTACFTGHRPKKLKGWSHAPYVNMIRTLADHLIRLSVNRGITNFVSGGAQGFDQLAFWAVHHAKKKRPDLHIQNIVFVPFKGQEGRWLTEGTFSQAEYAQMLACADAVFYCTEGHPMNAVRALFHRNECMVDASSVVIALCNTPSDQAAGAGGTEGCMKYARGKSRMILRFPFDTSGTELVLQNPVEER